MSQPSYFPASRTLHFACCLFFSSHVALSLLVLQRTEGFRPLRVCLNLYPAVVSPFFDHRFRSVSYSVNLRVSAYLTTIELSLKLYIHLLCGILHRGADDLPAGLLQSWIICVFVNWFVEPPTFSKNTSCCG